MVGLGLHVQNMRHTLRVRGVGRVFSDLALACWSRGGVTTRTSGSPSLLPGGNIVCKRCAPNISLPSTPPPARYCKTSYFHDLEQPELYPPGDLAFLRPFKQRHMKESFWDAVWISANGAPLVHGGGVGGFAHAEIAVLRVLVRSLSSAPFCLHADLVGEGIQVSAAMLLHHRVYSLMDALESSLQHAQNLAATPVHCEARPS